MILYSPSGLNYAYATQAKHHLASVAFGLNDMHGKNKAKNKVISHTISTYFVCVYLLRYEKQKIISKCWFGIFYILLN